MTLSDPTATIAAYLSALTIAARVVYAIVARVVAPHPRARAIVEVLAAISPDLLRAAVQAYRAVTGREVASPLIDARDAELARLRAALAAAQAAQLPLRPRVPPPDPQSGRASLGALVVVLLCGACSGGATLAGAATETATVVIAVARKVRSAICSETLDPYLGTVRERVVLVREAPDASPAAVDDATADAGDVE